MPVLEHETHEKVKQKEGFRYGCWNLPRPTDGTSYLAPDRLPTGYGNWELGNRRVVNVMSRECRYDMSLTDPACEGCDWQGSGEKYAEEIRRNGK